MLERISAARMAEQLVAMAVRLVAVRAGEQKGECVELTVVPKNDWHYRYGNIDWESSRLEKEIVKNYWGWKIVQKIYHKMRAWGDEELASWGARSILIRVFFCVFLAKICGVLVLCLIEWPQASWSARRAWSRSQIGLRSRGNVLYSCFSRTCISTLGI